MSDDAKVTTILYKGILPEEENILKQMEGAILKTLLANHITSRPVWQGYTEPRGRVLRLLLPEQPKPRLLMKLLGSELQKLSADDFNSRLNESINLHLR